MWNNFSLYADSLRQGVIAIATNHNVEGARLEDGLTLCVKVLQLFTINAEGDAALLSSLQMDALEATQLLDRTGYRGSLLVDVELYDLVAITLTGIADHDAGFYRTVGSHGGTAQRQVRIAEGGIRQSVAEGVEWVVAHFQVVAGIFAVFVGTLLYRTTRIQVVIIERYLSEGLWHGDGETSAGCSIAQKHVGNGIASL